MPATSNHTLRELTGSCSPQSLARFHHAIKAKNPNKIAESAARLLSESDLASTALYHAAAFAPFVTKQARFTGKLNYADRARLAKREWTRLSKQRDLPSDPFLKRLVLSAVVRSIR